MVDDVDFVDDPVVTDETDDARDEPMMTAKSRKRNKTQKRNVAKRKMQKRGWATSTPFDSEIYNIIDAPGPCCYSIAMRWDD